MYLNIIFVCFKIHLVNYKMKKKEALVNFIKSVIIKVNSNYFPSGTLNLYFKKMCTHFEQ